MKKLLTALSYCVLAGVAGLTTSFALSFIITSNWWIGYASGQVVAFVLVFLLERK